MPWLHHQYSDQLYAEDQEKAGNIKKCGDVKGKHLEYSKYTILPKVVITTSHCFQHRNLRMRVIATDQERMTSD